MKALASLLIVATLYLPWHAKADEPEPFIIYPELPEHATKITGFIPQGWSLRDSCSGLLDNDEIEETVIVIQLDDTLLLRKIIDDDTMTEQHRPRILVILSQNPDNSYRKVCQANQAIMTETEGDNDKDPFEKIEVKNKVLNFSFRGGTDQKWHLSYHFKFQDNGYFLTHALSQGEGKEERYRFEYNLASGELNIEVSDENDPNKMEQYQKIKNITTKPKLENFLPLSFVVDESEGIIF